MSTSNPWMRRRGETPEDYRARVARETERVGEPVVTDAADLQIDYDRTRSQAARS